MSRPWGYVLSALAGSALTLAAIELRNRRAPPSLNEEGGDDDRHRPAGDGGSASCEEANVRQDEANDSRGCREDANKSQENDSQNRDAPIRKPRQRGNMPRPSFSGSFNDVDGESRRSIASISSDCSLERNYNQEDTYADHGTNVVVLPEEGYFGDDKSIVEAQQFNEQVVSKLNSLEDSKLLLRRTRSVSALASRLMAAPDEESCYEVASRLLVPLFDVDRCSYVLMKDAEHIIIKGVVSKKRKYTTKLGLSETIKPIKDTMVGLCAETLQQQYCPKTSESELKTQRTMHKVGINTILATPILVNGNKFAGAIVLSMNKEDAFREYDRILVQDIASMLGANIYAKRMRRGAEESNKISREMLHSMIPAKVIEKIQVFWDRNSQEYHSRRSSGGSLSRDSIWDSSESSPDDVSAVGRSIDRNENNAPLQKTSRPRRCQSVNDRINFLSRMNALGDSDSNEVNSHIIVDTSAMEIGTLTSALYAENVKDVVVIFTDIVGFSRMSLDMTPMEVVDLLQALFGRFDALCGIHGVQKLETIGDAYICTANLFDEEGGSVKDAALNAVSMAKDMVMATQEVLSSRNSLFETLQIRVGMHVGEVTCGVLGERLPKFTVFGHTVNLAARMEQTCKPQCIRMTEAAYELVADAEEEDVYKYEVVSMKNMGDVGSYVLAPLDAIQQTDDNFF